MTRIATGQSRNAATRSSHSPAFAGRQTLYEHYFFGDPVRMAGALVGSYDREPYKARVRSFLEGTQN